MSELENGQADESNESDEADESTELDLALDELSKRAEYKALWLAAYDAESPQEVVEAYSAFAVPYLRDRGLQIEPAVLDVMGAFTAAVSNSSKYEPNTEAVSRVGAPAEAVAVLDAMESMGLEPPSQMETLAPAIDTYLRSQGLVVGPDVVEALTLIEVALLRL
jgi:hypothetical protein